MSAGEDEITEWFARQSDLAESDFPIGIGDDMAEIRLGRAKSILITTDMLLDKVHFNLDQAGFEQVGYKAMAVSLSDCAAMASQPVAVVVSVALPKGFGQKELKELHRGIVSAGGKYGCELIGGDITSWEGKEQLAISVAMLSKPAANEPVRRNGAKVGDVICVTGTLGGSRAGKHLKFEPRVKEAMKIAGMVTLHSMIDISDGLSSDLNRICRQSKVGALIDSQKIPISEDAKRKEQPIEAALNDGEDFELMFTLSSKECDRLFKLWDEPLTISRIGEVTNTGKMQIKTAEGKVRDLQPLGYDHLRG